MQVVLRIVNSKTNVRLLRLTARSTTIGRGADCQLKVMSDQVSRRHCEIVVHDFWVTIKDLKSANGTFVNGRQIPPDIEIPLTPGTRVALGSLQFHVEYALPGSVKLPESASGGESSAVDPDEIFDAESTQPMKVVAKKQAAPLIPVEAKIESSPAIPADVPGESKIVSPTSRPVPVEGSAVSNSAAEEHSVPVQGENSEVRSNELYSVDEEKFEDMMNFLESLAPTSSSLEENEGFLDANLDQLGAMSDSQSSSTLSVTESESKIVCSTDANSSPERDSQSIETTAVSAAEMVRSDPVHESIPNPVTTKTPEPSVELPSAPTPSLPVRPAPLEIKSSRPKLVQVLDVSKSLPMPTAGPRSGKSTTLPVVSQASVPLENGQCSILPRIGHLLGVDYSSSRTGFAICNSDQTIVSLIESGKQHEPVDAQRVNRLIADHGIVGMVVSLPPAHGTEESQKSLECRKFAAWLVEVTGLPVTFASERSSSRFAAQVMLQGFLDGRRAEKSKPQTSERVLTEC